MAHEGHNGTLTMSTQSNQQVQATPRAGAWFPQVAAQLGAVLLDTLGLAAAVEWHAHRFQRYTGVRYALTVNDTAGFEAPEAYSTGLFEMLGDALTQVACCAGRVSRVDIALKITPREVGMIMRHDGIGAGDAMAQIGRRAQAYQGLCEVARAPEAGTTLTVRLPLR
jgi:signal transduction histidine kinase